MSLTVTGYVNGKPQYRDDGPGHARIGRGMSTRAVYGGEFVTGGPGPSELARAAGRRNKARTAARRQVDYPVCGHWIAVSQSPCGRRVGHRDNHRSRKSLDTDAARRRAA